MTTVCVYRHTHTVLEVCSRREEIAICVNLTMTQKSQLLKKGMK